jgi:hypothetical protein
LACFTASLFTLRHRQFSATALFIQERITDIIQAGVKVDNGYGTEQTGQNRQMAANEECVDDESDVLL